MIETKFYTLREYIRQQLWLPESDRKSGVGTQRDYAKFIGKHYMQVNKWVMKGWIIDEEGHIYMPRRSDRNGETQ